MSALPPLDGNDVRFDIDHVMDRALAANEADVAQHGRILPTLADTVEVAYESFGIGLQKMTEQRYAEAVPWLATAVDNNVEFARPMLGISIEAAEPIPACRTALGDECEDTLARQLADDDAKKIVDGETPIFNTVLADQRGSETPENTELGETHAQAGQLVPHSEFDGQVRHAWQAYLVHDRSVTRFESDLLCVLSKLLKPNYVADRTFDVQFPAEELYFAPGHFSPLPNFALVTEIACVCVDRGPDVEVQGITPGGLLVIQSKSREARAAQTARSAGTGHALPPGSSVPAEVGQPAVQPIYLDARIPRLVTHLPKLLQEVIVLRVVVGLSAKKTAEVLGMTEGGVRVAQHRALTRLRGEVGAEKLLEGVVNDLPSDAPTAGTQRCLPGARS